MEVESGMNWFYIVINFCVCLVMTLVISPSFSKQFDAYRKLDRRKKMGWDQRVTSLVHSTVVSIFAVYHVLVTDEPYSNPSELARFTIHIVMAYIIQDMFVILVLGGDMDSTADLIHHVFTAVLCYISQLGFEYWHLVAILRVLAEMSTPFLNVRWFIFAFGKNKEPIFNWNNLAFAVAFFASRIMIMPFFYRTLRGLIQTEIYNNSVGPILHVTWILFVIAMDILNLYWFSFIAKKVVKTLKTMIFPSKAKLNDAVKLS